ncbi:helix-turn-helix domain-containing protein [Roseicyclus amphidinii]|uniref:helix-turn-helix domain-containing protein n=1 Tax=Roseicyclus amphidinii TaxID=3034232 RepID=UPI0024E0F9F8|nr:helix-turn-helix transcriptional regulator [Roseicyclus sp. Amp-Y-6]
MDAAFFKKRQKTQGVTADQIAALAGRDRSNVSKIYAGQQKMTLPWAQAFATALDLPLDEVLERAGEVAPAQARTLRPGFSDGDAVPYQAQTGSAVSRTLAEALGAGRAGLDIWQVRTNALLLLGYRKGDMMLVDGNAAERARAGDVVLAQVYDLSIGAAVTVLREYRPPVLVGIAPGEEMRVHVVDGTNVSIRGIVVASWRVGLP